MIKSSIDVEFSQHVEKQTAANDMVKKAFEEQQLFLDNMPTNYDKARYMIKKAHREDQAVLAAAYAAEAQVYATLDLADAIRGRRQH